MPLPFPHLNPLPLSLPFTLFLSRSDAIFFWLSDLYSHPWLSLSPSLPLPPTQPFAVSSLSLSLKEHAQATLTRSSKAEQVALLSVFQTPCITVNSLLELLDTALNLPVFVTRMAGILGALMFIVHTCVCLYWLVKEASSSAVSGEEGKSKHGIGTKFNRCAMDMMAFTLCDMSTCSCVCVCVCVCVCC